jgi:hypothetical protein
VLTLALVDLAFLPSFVAKTFSMFSRSRSMDLVNSGNVLWFISYWFLQSVGQVDSTMLARVASLRGTFPFSVEATASELSQSVGRWLM